MDLSVNCDLLFLHVPCMQHTYKFTAWKSVPGLQSNWCIFHGELKCTNSLQLKSFHVSLLSKQTCVFIIIKMANPVAGKFTTAYKRRANIISQLTIP